MSAQNLGPINSTVALTYGPFSGLQLASDPTVLWPYTTGPCSWHSQSQVYCVSVPGVGGPSSTLAFQLTVGGQSGPLFSATSVAYAPPAIAGLEFSPLDTRGGGAFNITGSNVSGRSPHPRACETHPFTPAARASRIPRVGVVLGERVESALPRVHCRGLQRDRRELGCDVLRGPGHRQQPRRFGHGRRSDECRLCPDAAIRVPRRLRAVGSRRRQRADDWRNTNRDQRVPLRATDTVGDRRPPRGRSLEHRDHSPVGVLQPQRQQPPSCVWSSPRGDAGHGRPELLRFGGGRANHLHDSSGRRVWPRVVGHDRVTDQRAVKRDVDVRSAVDCRLHGPWRDFRGHHRIPEHRHRRAQQ